LGALKVKPSKAGMEEPQKRNRRRLFTLCLQELT
jgi:hypothetical protein